MGYTTEFKGQFSLNTKLDDVTFNFLKKLNETRRMARKIDAKYGIDGEFFVDGDGDGFKGQNGDSTIVDTNKHPRTQPGLWCKWTPTDDRMHIEWDGAEKFYNYIEWIEYLISKVLAPRGYVVNGNVKWRGEDFDDSGVIEINDNIVMGKRLIVDYSINKVLGPIGAVSSGWRNSKPAINSKRNVGLKSDGSKTRHQLAKERQEEQTRQLEAQIKLLEDQLKNKEKELKREVEEKKEFKKLTVQDLMLEKMRGQVQFGGSLDDFKSLLKNLLEG